MKIFWSWQSDTPGKIGRFLVRDALNDAIEKLRADNDVAHLSKLGLGRLPGDLVIERQM